jgi:amphi-Trp domain-containing protein
MAHTLYENHCTLTCGELAAELRHIADRLDAGTDLTYGIGNSEITVPVPRQVHRELEIDSAVDGDLTLDFAFHWAPTRRK